MSARQRSVRAIERPATDWRTDMAKRGGRIVGDERNVLHALRNAPDLSGLLRFNEFANRVEFALRPPWRDAMLGEAWTDADDVDLQATLQAHGIDVRARTVVADCGARVARDYSYHPVRRYLDGLRWDGEPRLRLWLVEYLNASGPPDYLAAVGRCWLVSAVARVMQPGCQADHVIVLEGPQGCGKSRTARTLAMQPEWFADSLPDIHGADAALQLSGRWIVELAELAAIGRSTLEAVKAFITRPVDLCRPPYGRRAVTIPRQCVFIATTNEAEYLRDSTGNRRFWPVRVGRIDLDGLARDVDQLWAEAVALFNADEPWHLTADETQLAIEEQRQREPVTELARAVGEWLERREGSGDREVAMADVLQGALGLDAHAPTYVEQAGRLGPQVAAALRASGYQRVRAIGRGASRRVIYRKANPSTRPETHRGS